MDEQQSEQKQFLDELGIKSETGINQDAWKGPEGNPEEGGTPEPEKTEGDELEEDKLKNRRERRLMAKVQAEREANIALNARLQALSEAQKLREDTQEADFLKLIDPIFGTADEKGVYDPRRAEATRLLKEALKGAYATAKKEAAEDALSRFNERVESESAAVREEEDNLDEGMDAVEERYNIDFSSKKARDKYLTLLEEVSPKDGDENIIEYAFDAAARLYQAEEGKANSRAKELASRSGIRSGSSQQPATQDEAFYSQMKSMGLLD